MFVENYGLQGLCFVERIDPWKAKINGCDMLGKNLVFWVVRDAPKRGQKYYLTDRTDSLIVRIPFWGFWFNFVECRIGFFYYDLGKNKDSEFDIGKKEFVIGKKEVKNKKAALQKTKNDKKKMDELEEVAKKAEGYYRSVDQKAYNEEKGKILLNEKARINK